MGCSRTPDSVVAVEYLMLVVFQPVGGAGGWYESVNEGRGLMLMAMRI